MLVDLKDTLGENPSDKKNQGAIWKYMKEKLPWTAP